jgi:hypothetical protein
MEALDGAVEFVGGHAGVALGGVEMLVSEQLLNLAEVRPRAEEFRGEHVPERVLGDVLGP